MNIQTKNKWDACLVWTLTHRCNMNCPFCYLYNTEDRVKDPVPRIDTDRLLASLEKTGRTYLILFTGGEPFLIPGFIEACKEITQKHYISINSNITTSNVERFATEIDSSRVRIVCAGTHILELERLGVVERFAANYQALKSNGFNIKTVEVAHPTIEHKVDDFRELFRDKYAIQVNTEPFYGKYESREFPKSYTEDELGLFEISGDEQEAHYNFGQACNAGYGVAVVRPNGDVFSCYQIDQKMGNVYTGFEWNRSPILCPRKLCQCSPMEVDPDNFNSFKDSLDRADRAGIALYSIMYFARLVPVYLTKWVRIILNRNIKSLYLFRKSAKHSR